jgi:hypothetical protein
MANRWRDRKEATMKPMRWVAGALVWLVAGLLGAVGFLLSVTIVLLPLGVPVLMLARRLFSLSVRLVLPRAAAHPMQEARKRARTMTTGAVERGRDALPLRGRSRRRAGWKRMRTQLLNARRRLTTP